MALLLPHPPATLLTFPHYGSYDLTPTPSAAQCSPQIDGRKLTEIINETHQNVKYLPNYDLGDNVVAIPDLAEAVKGATALVFVMPHQFLEKCLQTIEGHVAPDARAISLIKVSCVTQWEGRQRACEGGERSPHDWHWVRARKKEARCVSAAVELTLQGVDVHGADIHIFADVIQKRLGIRCSALSGANIASEVAAGRFSETTIGYRKGHKEDGLLWKQLFGESPEGGVACCPPASLARC